MGRFGSCIALVSLWMIYILFSILQAYGMLGEMTFGITDDFLKQNPDTYKCYKGNQPAAPAAGGNS